MARYINAENLTIHTGWLDDENGETKTHIQFVYANEIHQQPTADVQEVIYCKNCKNYYKIKNGDVVCEEFGGYVKDNDFCSRGKRKDGKD